MCGPGEPSEITRRTPPDYRHRIGSEAQHAITHSPNTEFH